MRYLLLAILIPSASLAAPVRQTGVSGVNMTGYVVAIDSEPAADVNISSTVYMGVSTATIVARGNRLILVMYSGVINNGSAVTATYNCGLYENGTLYDTITPRTVGASGTAQVFSQSFDTASIAGSVNYHFDCKSSVSNASQAMQNSHLSVFEF